MQFPIATGKNLLRQTITVPAELEGPYKIVFVAFQRWHQSLIDSWLPAIAQLERKYPTLRHYELPVLPGMNVISRTFINEGMRAGIPDPVARATTITLYVDKVAFLQSLGLSDDNNIHVMLLDQNGRILWHATGGFSPETAQSLEKSMQKLAV